MPKCEYKSEIKIIGQTNLTHAERNWLIDTFKVDFINTNAFSYEEMAKEHEIIDRMTNAKVIAASIQIPLRRKILKKCKNLKRIIAFSSGIDHIDQKFCSEHGIEIRSAKDYCSRIVAERTISFFLLAMHNTLPALRNVRQGHWDYLNFQGKEIFGKIATIVGNGSIGSMVAQLATSLGMQVNLITSTSSLESIFSLLAISDIISLHLPLNSETEKWLDINKLSILNNSTAIINTSRGALIDELALGKYLTENPESIAMLDVLSEEPPNQNHILLNLPNVYITPHVAWNSKESDDFLSSYILREVELAYNEILFRI